jgi:flagellar motor switch protein FliM
MSQENGALQELQAGCFEADAKWPALQEMKLPLAVRIPLGRLSLRQLRELSAGTVLETECPSAEEVPLYVSDVALSWCEFVVVDGVMAARLTRLG